MKSRGVYLGLLGCWLVTVSLGAQEVLVPGGAEAHGLERLVNDTIVDDHDGNLSNWEPYTSVLGNSAFLIEGNTFARTANGGIDPVNQRYSVAIQPTDGSENLLGECFFADDGTPYREKINNYRQDGNPGRVAGDKRPGAVNFITGGEASPHEFAAFLSDDRWDTGVVRNGRYATVQTFALDPETLEQLPRSLAIDAMNGRLEAGDPDTDQIGRFGGGLAGLSDGNFVVVVDDRSGLHQSGTATTAVILDPDGEVVRETFVIDVGDIWSNVTAYEDGFCVRKGGVLRFFDNSGDLVGEVDQSAHDLDVVDAAGSPVDFDRGRGDGTRIASHINTPYVFLAGAIQHSVDGVVVEDVFIAAYDSRDQSFVAAVNVNELTEEEGGTDDGGFRADFERVSLAVDALDRVAVTWEVLLADTWLPLQTVLRVLAFDGTTGTFGYLTPTLFPFENFQGEDFGVTPVRTSRPSVSMTTREICVAAKGEINSENIAEDGADLPELSFYTVISHPAPMDDPTPPVVGPGGALLRPGDANFDGSLNISDPILALNFLFGGGELTECFANKDGGEVTLTTSGLAVLDWNGDAAHNISDPVGSLNFQFASGTVHALGLDCITIADGDCEDNCVD